MALEEHVIYEPPWIKALVEDVVIDAFKPMAFIGQLGYRYWEPEHPGNHFPGWQVCVFPTPNEVRAPHAYDGVRYVNGFHLDVAAIVRAMGKVESIVWTAPTSYNGNFDGPELSMQGQFAGKHVWLRVFHMPPPDEPSSYYVNPGTGETWEKPVE